MLPRNWLLMLFALAAAIALFIMVNGCASSRRAGSSAELRAAKDKDAVVMVVEHKFMFDIGQWWVRQRERRPGETLPAILKNEVYSAQIIVALEPETTTSLSELAWESRRREVRGESRDVSPVITDDGGGVEFAFYWRNVGSSGHQKVQERIAFARCEELPGMTFAFYGTWAEKDEDEMGEQMERMIVSLRPIPDWYLETHKGGAQ